MNHITSLVLFIMDNHLQAVLITLVRIYPDWLPSHLNGFSNTSRRFPFAFHRLNPALHERLQPCSVRSRIIIIWSIQIAKTSFCQKSFTVASFGICFPVYSGMCVLFSYFLYFHLLVFVVFN